MPKNEFGEYVDEEDDIMIMEEEEPLPPPRPKARRKIVTDPKGFDIRTQVEKLFSALPLLAQRAMVDVASDTNMNDVIRMLGTRGAEIGPMGQMLVGAYMNPSARNFFDEKLTECWVDSDPNDYLNHDGDIVVGGGLHAAVYCAIAYARTGKRPLVIDGSPRVGGVFGTTLNPAFYLNSRNRPGPLGLPSIADRVGSLNVIPGAPVQPADLSGDEYADNGTLGWAIRCTLAMNASVLSGYRVVDIEQNGVRIDTGSLIKGKRVIVATGLGAQRRFGSQDNQRVISYFDFLRRFDGPFPLQGMGRVAVIGAGDSGRTTIEALTGQGPARSHYSIASLDYPRGIDWFGVEAETCSDWERVNRSRYKGIGRNLPRRTATDLDQDGDPVSGSTLLGPSRVTPFSERANDITLGFDEVMVNGRPYDQVIIATGFQPVKGIRALDEFDADRGSRQELADVVNVGQMPVARVYNNGGLPTYTVGPAAALPMMAGEMRALPPAARNLAENTVAIFRYARKTAAAAQLLN